MDNIKKILWRGSVPGVIETKEVLTFSCGANNIARGKITGTVKGAPIRLSYEIIIGKEWNIKSVLIKTKTDTEKLMHFAKNSSDEWSDERGKQFPHFSGCLDIDISLTPFTNTIPVKRLNLQRNKPAEISVMYFNILDSEIKEVFQRYTYLGANQYRYENLDSGFNTEIEFDKDGFVTVYPGVWERI